MINQYNPAAILAWRANMDFSPCTDLSAVQNYMAKYASKEETQTASYRDIARSIAPYVNSAQVWSSNLELFCKPGNANYNVKPALSVATKLMNRFIGERDWSAQEVSHITFGLPLHASSRAVIHFDCRHPSEMGTVVELDADGNEQPAGESVMLKYSNRRTDYEDATLFDFVSNFEHGARKVHAPRPRAPSRAIVYSPQYSYEPTHQDYEHFCRVKVALHHPWREYPTLPWRGQTTWASAHATCQVCFLLQSITYCLQRNY